MSSGLQLFAFARTSSRHRSVRLRPHKHPCLLGHRRFVAPLSCCAPHRRRYLTYAVSTWLGGVTSAWGTDPFFLQFWLIKNRTIKEKGSVPMSNESKTISRCCYRVCELSSGLQLFAFARTPRRPRSVRLRPHKHPCLCDHRRFVAPLSCCAPHRRRYLT